MRRGMRRGLRRGMRKKKNSHGACTNCWGPMSESYRSIFDAWEVDRRRVESLESRIRALVWQLRMFEWQGLTYQCPSCRGYDDNGHAEDCELSALLEED